ncbi:unnamed protein product, partial [Didymodactylos carnosus]
SVHVKRTINAIEQLNIEQLHYRKHQQALDEWKKNMERQIHDTHEQKTNELRSIYDDILNEYEQFQLTRITSLKRQSRQTTCEELLDIHLRLEKFKKETLIDVQFGGDICFDVKVIRKKKKSALLRESSPNKNDIFHSKIKLIKSYQLETSRIPLCTADTSRSILCYEQLDKLLLFDDKKKVNTTLWDFVSLGQINDIAYSHHLNKFLVLGEKDKHIFYI